MKTPRSIIASLFAASIALPMHAQIVEIVQAPGILYQINSMADGPKLIYPFSSIGTAGTFTIYDPDFSVYRVLNFPAPPPGMTWTSLGYITQALFDTDDSNIEFMMYAGSFDETLGGVFIFREDGEQLFVKNPGYNMTCTAMGIRSEPIITVGGQSYMLLYDDSNSHIYSLPGTFPCDDCSSNAGVGISGDSDVRSSITLFPNPASQMVTLALGGAQADEVAMVDATGKLLRTERTMGLQQVQLSTAGLAQGRYFVLVRNGGLPIATLSLIIER